ncbi:MAG: T9SS type A sorting domain-containing protein [Bacteroidales bacterium]|nr:T9SS type A sorting domain-containing protein [Bacteroidales bacterium]
MTLYLYDSNGKLILTQDVLKSSHIDISRLNPGTYFLQAVYSDGRKDVKKIVKTRK